VKAPQALQQVPAEEEEAAKKAKAKKA
jgi:hypothetical protein